MQLQHERNPATGPDENASEPERHSRIAEGAYQRAHARNFEPGGELEDWLSAEREVDGE
jgi:hypothetical protein